jgi:hypothetical protein
MELDTTTTMNWKQSRAMTAWQGRKERLLRRTHKSVRPRAAGLISEQFHAATFCQIVLRASCFLLPVDATILNFQSAKQTKWVQIFDCDISRNSKEKFSSAYNCAFQFSMPMCYLALTTVLYHSVSPYTVSLSCCYRCCCRIGSQSDGRSTWRYGIFVESERDRRSTQAMFRLCLVPLNFLNLALCKKKIPRHIKLMVHVWSTKYRRNQKLIT